MKNLVKLLMFALLASVTALPLFSIGSEELDNTLADLRKVFENGLMDIDSEFLDNVDKCRDGYAILLEKAEEQYTAKGDLDAVMLIRKEKARFSQDRAVDDEIAPGTHEVIVKATKAYLAKLEEANTLRNRKAGTLARQYVAKLEGLMKSLTTEKKIDEALRVRAEIEKAKKDPAVSTSLAQAPEKAANGTCSTCDGKGFIVQSCPSCNGSGKCSYCGGTGKRTGLGGQGVTCFACTGSKKCKKCGGTGKIKTKCGNCNGTGKTR